jgi:superfamily II RNA helicase
MELLLGTESLGMRTHGNKTFPGAVSFNHFDGYTPAISFSVSKSRCAQAAA